MSTQDEKVVEVLNLVDEIVQLKQALSTSMSRGFMDIAEERYYKRSALLGEHCVLISEPSVSSEQFPVRTEAL